MLTYYDSVMELVYMGDVRIVGFVISCADFISAAVHPANYGQRIKFWTSGFT